jgi:hypothetical protein
MEGEQDRPFRKEVGERSEFALLGGQFEGRGGPKW